MCQSVPDMVLEGFTVSLMGGKNNGSFIPEKPCYSIVWTYYIGYQSSEGYKMNKPVELKELMNSRGKPDISITIRMLLNICQLEFQTTCFGISERKDSF